MCKVSTCRRSRCRELSHNGYTIPRDLTCPNGHTKEEQQLGVWLETHLAAGIFCTACATYFVPDDIPQELRDTMEPWELGRWSNLGMGAGNPGVSIKEAR